MIDCIFCKIASHKEPAEFVYEDEDVMAFPDAAPIKPIHILIIPKKHVGDFKDLSDASLQSKLFSIVQKMIEKFDLGEKGYRIGVNGGGSQHVDHLHFHLLGPMGKRVV